MKTLTHSLRKGFSRFFVSCLLIVLCGGCQPEGPRKPLKGMVTFQGKPVATGTVTFLTAGERKAPVCGAMIVDGRFDIPAEQGLEPGTYRVAISWPGGPAPRTPEEIEAGASARATEKIPAQYNAETKLTVQIEKSGKNDFTLNLD